MSAHPITKFVSIALIANLTGISIIQSVSAQVGEYCQFDSADIATKENLRVATFAESPRRSATIAATKEYKAVVQQHSQALTICRQRSWLKNQGIWLRLYPCDVQSGRLAQIMDRIANKGYNQVFIEVISDGKILLPQSDNPTAWTSLISSEKYKNADLLKLAIATGQERGIKVHAWLFTMNVGLGYARGVDRNGNPKFTQLRQNAIARNANGDSTISIVENVGKNSGGEVPNNRELFIDPYNYQAQSDLYLAVNEVVRRKPDGVAFDYIRYKRGAGAASVVSNVRSMWIYGEASFQALLNRAENLQGRELVKRFLKQGFVTVNDLQAVKKLYPQETTPRWQGLRPSAQANPPISYWQNELWRLAVGHAFIGVTYYLGVVSKPTFQQGIPASLAFFSDGNQPVGNGFDSRLQPWHLFTSAYEWQPMTYAVCGKADCIVSQVRKVFDNAPIGAKVSPILVGQWNSSFSNRPSLKEQMQAIRAAVPKINSISHFAFGWQSEEIEFSRSRQACKL
jgi:uncharacterized lipoprotein YddW (UPF0748 family)